MDKPIIIIKSTIYMSQKKLGSYQRAFENQLAREGLIVLPNNFEYLVISDDFEYPIIEVKNIDWNEPKKVKKQGGFLKKVFKRLKVIKNT